MSETTDFVSGMKRQVGWFVLLGISAFVLVIILVTIRSNIFAKKFILFVEPPSASGFYEGQQVKFQGFGVGHIDDIQLQHQGQVRIRLSLLERYRPMLHQGAVLHLTKEGVIGEQIVEITAGDTSKPPLAHEQLLTYETEASLEQLLVDLKPAVGNANVLLKELAVMSQWMNDSQGSFQMAFSNLQQMTHGVQGTSIEASMVEMHATLQQLTQLVASLNQENIAAHTAAVLVSSEEAMKQVKPLGEHLNQQLPETLKKLDALLLQVHELSKTLTTASQDVTQLTPELPGVAHALKGTLSEMQRTLRQLQGSWILGNKQAHQQAVDGVEVAAPILDVQP